MKKLLAAVVMLLTALAPLTLAPAANAVEIGHEGCTPGFWKQPQHLDSWEEATPATIFGSRYTSATPVVANLTFLEALDQPGGPGLDGASRILARHATAAWLNAANEGVGYPWRRNGTGLDGRPALVPTVNAAFASGDRATMLALATRLDQDNNLGCFLS
jgi:hypothetical protein